MEFKYESYPFLELKACNDSFKILRFKDNLFLDGRWDMPDGVYAEYVLNEPEDNHEILKTNMYYDGKAMFIPGARVISFLPKQCITKKIDMYKLMFFKEKYLKDIKIDKFRVFVILFDGERRFKNDEDTNTRLFKSSWFFAEGDH